MLFLFIKYFEKIMSDLAPENQITWKGKSEEIKEWKRKTVSKVKCAAVKLQNCNTLHSCDSRQFNQPPYK